MWSQVAQQHYRQEEDGGSSLPFSTRYWLSDSGSASCSRTFWKFWFCCFCHHTGCAALARVDCENREQHKSSCSKKIHLHRWVVTKNLIQMLMLRHSCATNNVRHVYGACGSLAAVWTCWFHSDTRRENCTFRSNHLDVTVRERTLISVGLTPVHACLLSCYCQIKAIILFLSIM